MFSKCWPAKHLGLPREGGGGWYHDGRSRCTCGYSLGRDQNPEVKMYLSRASCSPNVSQQSIWASQGRAAEGGITMVVRVVLPREGGGGWYHDGRSRRTCGYSLGRDQNPEVKMYLSRASCSPNVSQQIIWASQGRAAEGGITMIVRVVLVGIP